ncbi:DUF4199 domain-containing protein [Aquimarina litoralis]|uniref:DUF4199 domain-containing protein n=1 Tax=Aquimarina litoralis TaxID=584605 RepID=UPI001C59935E|nr:DUF4199 domain-containing protein [Aquimarina litoralis]MBW1295741.1 DUF4199 family protein [Aquimarina litoralis]
MINFKKPIISNILKYGVIFGIILSLFIFLIYLNGDYTNQNLFHLTVLILITSCSIIAGLLSYKKDNNKALTIMEAIILGTGISLLGGFISVIIEVLIANLDADIINNLKEYQYEKITKNNTNISKEKIDQLIRKTNEQTTPISWIIKGLAEDLIVGIVFSLIGGLIIRKKKKESLT